MKLMESAWAEFFLLISSVNVDVTIEVVVGIIVFLIFLYSRQPKCAYCHDVSPSAPILAIKWNNSTIG